MSGDTHFDPRHVVFEDPALAEHVRRVGLSLGRRLTFLSIGRHRAVFRHGTIVIKLPLCEAGAIDNHIEHDRSRKAPDRLGRTRLLLIEDVQVLAMEYLEPHSPSRADYDLHGWLWAIDCAQVGHDRHGRLKAYDFA